MTSNNSASYEQFFNLSVDMLAVAGTDGYFQQINPAFERTLGYTLAELKAKPFVDFVHPDDVQATLNEVGRLAQGATTLQFENRYRCKDGSYKWLAWTSQPAPDGSLYAIARDVSAQKTAQVASAQNQLLLQSVLDNTPAVVYAKEFRQTNGQYMLINSVYENIFNLRRDQIIGKTDFDIFPAAHAEAFRQVDLKVFETGQAVQLEETAPQADGVHTYLSVKFPLFGDDGRPYAVCGISTDITDTKRREAALRAASNLQNAIVEHAALAVISTNTEGIITSFNPAAEKMLGYTEEEMVNKLSPATFHDLNEVVARAEEFSKELGVTIEPGFEVFVAKSRRDLPNTYEWTYIHKNGTRFPISLSISALRDAQGEINGFLGLATDITQRKQDENLFKRRADQLETVTEVSAAAATTRETATLLQSTVDLAKERFGLYHAHIYLLDEAGDTLVLTSGAGEVGRKMVSTRRQIPLSREQSLVARAARERQAIIVNDVRADPGFLPHPLLLETRAELAVPILVGEAVLGVFDVQADSANRFDQVDAQIQTALAAQLGVALQNARFYEQTQKALEDVRILNRRLTHEGWETQFAARTPGFSYDTNGVAPMIAPPANAERVVPLAVGEEQIGQLTLEGAQGLAEDADFVLNAVAKRLSAHVENLRLTEQTQVALAEAETLYRVSSQLTQSASPAEVLEAASAHARSLGVTGSTLLYIENDAQGNPEWAEVVATGQTDSAVTTPIGTRFHLPSFPISKIWLAEPGRAALLPDMATHELADANLRALLAQSHTHGTVLMPLNIKGRWVGMITFSWNRVVNFTERDQRVFNTLAQQTAPVIDSLRAFQQTQIALAETENLYKVSNQLTQSTTPEEVLEAASAHARSLGANNGTLFYVDNDVYGAPEWVEVVAVWQVVGQGTPVGLRFYLPEFPISKIWLADPTRASLFTDLATHEMTDANLRVVLEQTNGHGTALLPLNVKGRWVGLLSFSWTTPYTFSERDRRVLNTLAQQTTPIIDSLRAFQQTQSALAEASVLYEASRRIAAAEDLSAVLAAVIDELNIPTIDRALIFSVDNSENVQAIQALAHWKSGDQLPPLPPIGTVFPRAAFPSIELVQAVVPTYIENASTDPRLDPASHQFFAEQQVAAFGIVPLRSGAQLNGVLLLQGQQPHAFTASEQRLVAALAGQIAVALENRRLFAEAQKRAAELTTVAQVSTTVAGALDPRQLLQDVVDLTKQSFNLYHAHIYLINAANDTLELTAGAGEVGRQMVNEGRRIPLNSEQSLVARAARERQGVIRNDARNDPNFLPHPLLPETRAEMAVPMIAGQRLIGVFDVQADTMNRFTASDVTIQTTLAAQIAIALQNARAFENAQQQAEREATLNLISQRIQSATTVDDALQVAVRELGRALGAPRTSVQLSVTAKR